ncbi:MAG: hypothetical protein JXK93_08765, partial [Sphaerochaetaceae bacterium]|nr:hypothetical protein [Sphaerochaetaceae bacterium]
RIIDLAFRHMKEPDVARDTLSEGLRAIRKLREREILSHEYRRLRAFYREAERVRESESSAKVHPRDEGSAYDPHCL